MKKTLSILNTSLTLKKTTFILFFFPIYILAQHTIKGRFVTNEDYKNVILYQITPLDLEYIVHATIKEGGTFNLKLDSTITKGMYKLVYALPKEEYSFDIIYNAKEDIELTFNSETGVSYQKSMENKLMSSYTNEMSLISQEIGKCYALKSKDSLALKVIFSKQLKTQLKFESDAKGTIALHFIVANKPYIPKNYQGLNTYVQNVKTHFFDNVNFNDIILQSSSFLTERTLNYVFGTASDTEDETITYKKNVDDVYKGMKEAKPAIKEKIFLELWQQMADSDYESVANYIADKYLIPLAKTLNDAELVKSLTQFKSLSIGNTAPDFLLKSTEDKGRANKKLTDLHVSENYLILFWSSTCSHCLNEIPQLKAYLKSIKKTKLQVIAIALEEDSKSWSKEIVKYPEFIHVLGINKWDNTIANSYNVNATPTYFLLNKDKKIIAKPYDLDALKELLETE